jgi:phosphate transport system permease protein
MNLLTLLAVLLVLSSIGYYLGRGRASALAGRAPSASLHSRPQYHGLYLALWAGLPALLILLAWLVLEPRIAEWALLTNLPPEARELDPARFGLLISDLKSHATGKIVSGEIEPAMEKAAEAYAAPATTWSASSPSS